MSTEPGRTDWAEDGEEVELAKAIPAPKVTKNKDGSETVVTFFLNEKGQRVKRTQRIKRIVKRYTERAGVAERRKWTKFGPEAGKSAGPQADTTTLGENIIFRPVVAFKSGAAAAQQETPDEANKTDALKKMQIKCRICTGGHFTTKCPFKDTMAPEGGDVDPANMPETSGPPGAEDAGGLGLGRSSYVPPHMRNGGGAGAGSRMDFKTERDDLSTLRVTNVCAELPCDKPCTNSLDQVSELADEDDLREIFSRYGNVTRVFLAKDKETGRAKGFAFISFADRSDAQKAKERAQGTGLYHLILDIDFATKRPDDGRGPKA